MTEIDIKEMFTKCEMVLKAAKEAPWILSYYSYIMLLSMQLKMIKNLEIFTGLTELNYIFSTEYIFTLNQK